MKLQDLTFDESDLFGPGTDLVVSLVAVFAIMLAVNATLYKKGKIDLQKIEANQEQILNEIAVAYHTQPRSIDKSRKLYGISIRRYSRNDIIVENELNRQRISFGSHILFDPDQAVLKPNGGRVLTTVGNVLKRKMDVIQELQIQGHADTQRTKQYQSNLLLAAHRAIAVFQFLQGLGIDPNQHLMSATSFGEYKPIQRTDALVKYNADQLSRDNDTEPERQLNRRVEIVLIYRKDL